MVIDSWWANNWKLVLCIAIFLIILDKGLTVANVLAVKKNYQNVDPLTIERNPVAKFFFKQFGLYGGTFAFSIVSLILFFIGIQLLSAATSIWAPNNKFGVALYLIILYYGFVIFNNFYFFFRYSGVLK